MSCPRLRNRRSRQCEMMPSERFASKDVEENTHEIVPESNRPSADPYATPSSSKPSLVFFNVESIFDFDFDAPPFLLPSPRWVVWSRPLVHVEACSRTRRTVTWRALEAQRPQPVSSSWLSADTPCLLGHQNSRRLSTLSALDKMQVSVYDFREGSQHSPALVRMRECQTFVMLASADPFASSRTTVISVLPHPSKCQRGDQWIGGLCPPHPYTRTRAAVAESPTTVTTLTTLRVCTRLMTPGQNSVCEEWAETGEIGL